jgi:hypothetical protein
VRTLIKYLAKGLGPEYSVQPGDAVAVPSWHGNDAPEVDIAIIANRYYDPMPLSADAFTFIEVSDSTYPDDRRVKIPLYVNAGVPAWIVNIRKHQVEFYGSIADLEEPNGKVYCVGESFEVLGVSIPVASLFPPQGPK